jgi:uncharacterized membrane protein YfbV (UPF0208 family)
MLRQIAHALTMEPRLVAALVGLALVFTGIWIETP